MGAWTSWLKLAEGRDWYDDDRFDDGAALYELAVGGPRGGIQDIVYIGETGNLRQRMAAYGQHGSHLARSINTCLRAGCSIYVRVRLCSTKRTAVALEADYLRRHSRYSYDWNIRGVAAVH